MAAWQVSGTLILTTCTPMFEMWVKGIFAQGTRSLGIIISMVLLQELQHQLLNGTKKIIMICLDALTNISVIIIKPLDSKADTW